jgi:hypothetical protein
MSDSDKNRDNRSQRQKFIDKARELGVDESEGAFDEKLGRIVRQRPKRKQDKEDDKAPE